MSEGNWILESLGPILERAAREQAAAEAHAAECTDRPCKRCERFVCACGDFVDGRDTCDRCLDVQVNERAFKPTRDSIPKHFHWALDARFEDLVARIQAPQSHIKAAIDRPPSGGMLLIGPTGSGKTSLVVAMLDSWVRADLPARRGSLFVEAGWLSRARARHKLGADEAPLVTEAMRCPLLVLDDLGSEREDRDGCITDVLWERTNEDRPIWITSGLAANGNDDRERLTSFAESLSRRYDGGFARRVIQGTKHVFLGKR